MTEQAQYDDVSRSGNLRIIREKSKVPLLVGRRLIGRIYRGRLGQQKACVKMWEVIVPNEVKELEAKEVGTRYDPSRVELEISLMKKSAHTFVLRILDTYRPVDCFLKIDSFSRIKLVLKTLVF